MKYKMRYVKSFLKIFAFWFIFIFLISTILILLFGIVCDDFPWVEFYLLYGFLGLSCAILEFITTSVKSVFDS